MTSRPRAKAANYHSRRAGKSALVYTFYPVPTRGTVMHRVIQGPDGNVWLTEMNANKVGRLNPRGPRP